MSCHKFTSFATDNSAVSHEPWKTRLRWQVSSYELRREGTNERDYTGPVEVVGLPLHHHFADLNIVVYEGKLAEQGSDLFHKINEAGSLYATTPAQKSLSKLDTMEEAFAAPSKQASFPALGFPHSSKYYLRTSSQVENPPAQSHPPNAAGRKGLRFLYRQEREIVDL